MAAIKISDINIEVVRKDIKNIHLGVYPPEGRVRLAAPLKVTDESIRLFAITKISWIKRQQRKFKDQQRIPAREYKDRESHYFLGDRYLLKIIEKEAVPKVVVKNKTFLELYIRPESNIIKKHEVMTEWYRKEIKKLIPEYIAKWENRMNVQVTDWQIKKMKTKWGSCNIEKKRIWINLELAKKPVHCLEYIIIHEMIHLLERNHNERFIDLIDKYLPNWRQLKTELNKLPVSHSDWKY